MCLKTEECLGSAKAFYLWSIYTASPSAERYTPSASLLRRTAALPHPPHTESLQKGKRTDDYRLLRPTHANGEETNDLDPEQNAVGNYASQRHNNCPAEDHAYQHQQNIKDNEFQRLTHMERRLRRVVAPQQGNDDACYAHQVSKHRQHFVLRDILLIEFRSVVIGRHIRSHVHHRLLVEPCPTRRAELRIILHRCAAIWTVLHFYSPFSGEKLPAVP